MSAPIVLGGVGATLGFEARRRATRPGHRRTAVAAIVVGLAAVVTGAGIWFVA